MFKGKINSECIQLIRNLTEKGETYNSILRECGKRGYKISYAVVRYHGHKLKKKKEIKFIESATQLCHRMTVWIEKMNKIMDSYEGEPTIQSKFAFHINNAFKNFVDLLKTPQIQNTQVNILQQQLEHSLMGVIDERRKLPINIPD